MPAFFESTDWATRMPFLPDLARFEILIAESFHSSTAVPFDPSFLATLAPEDWNDLHFHFQPSVKLFSSAWPVVDLWHARKTPLKELMIDLIDRHQHALIHRNGFEVRCQALDSLQYEMLSSLFLGHSLGEACEYLAERAPDQELPLGEWFQSWASLGILACSAESTQLK